MAYMSYPGMGYGAPMYSYGGYSSGCIPSPDGAGDAVSDSAMSCVCGQIFQTFEKNLAPSHPNPWAADPRLLRQVPAVRLHASDVCGPDAPAVDLCVSIRGADRAGAPRRAVALRVDAQRPDLAPLCLGVGALPSWSNEEFDQLRPVT